MAKPRPFRLETSLADEKIEPHHLSLAKEMFEALPYFNGEGSNAIRDFKVFEGIVRNWLTAVESESYRYPKRRHPAYDEPSRARILPPGSDHFGKSGPGQHRSQPSRGPRYDDQGNYLNQGRVLAYQEANLAPYDEYYYYDTYPDNGYESPLVTSTLAYAQEHRAQGHPRLNYPYQSGNPIGYASNLAFFPQTGHTPKMVPFEQDLNPKEEKLRHKTDPNIVCHCPFCPKGEFRGLQMVPLNERGARQPVAITGAPFQPPRGQMPYPMRPYNSQYQPRPQGYRTYPWPIIQNTNHSYPSHQIPATQTTPQEILNPNLQSNTTLPPQNLSSLPQNSTPPRTQAQAISAKDL
ncbi:hypothetical protein KQX54_011987 [Cotesia glomerata]|uniref:Uncharacterized protein n=1 Tax=Cotesia glomerata TaxID=32391 RepID=A0AAV7I8Z7_COTGL|nr:hypothetical protein KQX54_011987 [Cotesia glomerata]